LTTTILLVIFYVFSPFLILYLTQRYRIIGKVGAVVVAYMIGIIAGNLGIIPESGRQVQEILTIITIPLAIPLLLFSANLKKWFSLAGKTAASMGLAVVSVVIMVFAGFFLLKNNGATDFWKIGGMLIGVYRLNNILMC